ncbi:MAG: ABC transporter ATP-binding protein [Alphaproteobacteria bacterium]|nr:ABC transporter ATP-binding protein [Alphaproteobacteria bacterium]
MSVDGLEVRYGRVVAASGVSLTVNPGEIIALLGPNGAGKTSVLRAIAGLIPAAQGLVEYFDGERPHRIDGRRGFELAQLGIASVPAQHVVLPRMTVEENLEIGGRYLMADQRVVRRAVEAAFERFPALKERRFNFAGRLSGGEQRQLAIARALIPRPRLMLLDEPSIGLAPKTLAEIFGLLARINAEDGVSILMVEQNVVKALEVANRAYVMRVGAMDFSGPSAEIAKSPRLADAYLGT